MNISFNDSARSYMNKTTRGSSTVGNVRDSKKNVRKWIKKLSEEEISRIYRGTEDVVEIFYTPEDWYSLVK